MTWYVVRVVGEEEHGQLGVLRVEKTFEEQTELEQQRLAESEHSFKRGRYAIELNDGLNVGEEVRTKRGLYDWLDLELVSLERQQEKSRVFLAAEYNGALGGPPDRGMRVRLSGEESSGFPRPWTAVPLYEGEEFNEKCSVVVMTVENSRGRRTSKIVHSVDEKSQEYLTHEQAEKLADSMEQNHELAKTLERNGLEESSFGEQSRQVREMQDRPKPTLRPEIDDGPEHSM